LAEALYILRKDLAEGAFVAAGDEVGLDEELIRSDVAAYESALEAGRTEEAVALYRGPFLDGFFVSEAPEFERWVEQERERHAAAFGRALESLAEAQEAAGDPLGAAEWWRQLTTHDPSSSRVVLRRMQALDAAGERMQALRIAADHSTFLRNEIGAEPDPDVEWLAEQFRTQPAPRRRVPPAPEPTPVLPTQVLAAAAAPDATGASRDDEPAPVHADDPGLTAAGLPSTRRLAAVLALAAVLLGFGLGEYRSRGASPAPDTTLDARRVAVFYLDDHSPGQDLRPTAAALTEELIHRLGQVDGLHVVSRHGVKPYRDRDVSPDSIARVLRVGSFVEGSIRRSGDTVRITVNLVDARTGTELRTGSLQQVGSDLFALEDGLIRQVADLLRGGLGVEIRLRERSAGTRNAAARERLFLAQELYDRVVTLLVGQNPLGRSGAGRMVARADSLCVEAAREDRGWTEPRVLRGWLAMAEFELAMPGAEREQRLRKALTFAGEALRLRTSDPQALELRGAARWQLSREMRERSAADSLLLHAEEDLTAALAADPTLARGWATLSQLMRLGRGRPAEADAAARRALAEDEFLLEAPLIVERLYRAELQAARYDSAQGWCRRGRERFPNDWRFVDCQLTLMGYPQASEPDVRLAWRLFEEAEQLDPPQSARAAGRPYFPIYREITVARVLARANLPDSARAVLERARRQVGADPELLRSFTYDEAYVRKLLGDDSAIVIGLLREYVRSSPSYRDFLRSDVKFRDLHDDPRFQAILR
jgi:TolB-like protein/tetratricopeptide (TPR) repeat protein